MDSDLRKFLLSHNLTKPSEVLELMADSLVKMKRRNWFEISIDTYGRFHEDKCFGCVATVTAINLLGLTKKQLFKDGLIYQYKRTKKFGDEIWMFERMIDSVRCGHLRYLFDVFEIRYNGEYDFRWRFSMIASTAELAASWRPNLAAIRETIKELKKRGL